MFGRSAHINLKDNSLIIFKFLVQSTKIDIFIYLTIYLLIQNQMEKNQKQSNPLIFDIAFTLTNKSQPYIYLNILLVTLQFALFLLKIYEIIDPSIEQIYVVPYQSLFTILAIVVGVFIVFTLVSYAFEWFPTLWFYFLLLLQAIQMIYVQVTVRCFTKENWCKSGTKSKLLPILVIILFTLIIALRLQCYNPFYDSLNALAMKTGKTIFYTYIYSWLLSLATNELIISSSAGSKQIVFFVTACYYSLIFTPPTFSPVISRTIILCANALFWTTGVAWLVPLVQELLGGTPISFWYYWGFSVPIVLLFSFLHSSKLMNSYDWKVLFFQKHSGDLTNLFLQVNELTKEVALIKKSDLGTNSPQFRKLWKIITIHNDKCSEPQCPLSSLNSLKIIRQDQLLQEKRFNQTVQKTLQFGLYCLTSQRQTYPNLITLSLEIANFQLEVYRLRTKGLQLYNKQWNNAQTQEKWAIYYMKKRIESFEGSGEASSGERQQVIASFKHQIQKSVGMLAEFWYFLSDPKCNLKKLYDLANVLFPQKRKVDQAWKYIRGLKNVDCHALYAKYLIRMFNDKQNGLKVLEQAKQLQVQVHQKQQVSAAAGQVPSEEHGVIFLEFDGKNSGVMYQVNSACQKLFGYNKGQLQGRKVNDIMPRFFAQHHDRILEHYQQTNRPRMMNKQRSIWGRSKNGYCFPFLICIKPVTNYFSQTNEVYASVKRDLWLKQKAFFFVDTDLNITDISASMLGIYPELAGRVFLKKKVPLSQILPDHQNILPKLVELQETHDLQITRTFNITSKQTFSQTLVFGVQAEQIITAVAGKIGYHFKLTKGGASSSYDPTVSNQSNLTRQKHSAYGKQFKLMASIKQGQKGKKIIYQGGLIKDASLMKSQMISRISQSIAKQKQFAKQQEVSRLATDWAGNIKTKRLQGTLIRQIHDLSQQSELNGVVEGNQNSQDEGQSSQVIKPSQLNAILEREKVNKPILLLKILAISILLVCTLLDILDYISVHDFKTEEINLLKSYTELSSLHAQTMYVNNFANRITVNGTKQTDLDIFAQQVFDLDSFKGSIPFSINSQLYYSDGSSQSMLLSFAINKLVSQSDLLASSQGTDATLFFVQYNAANGLQVGCSQALKVTRNYILINYSKGIIFLVICLSLVVIAFVIQNIVLRRVLDKKADILNIFFEIPRYTCSFLQKQCQRFIQKLTNNQQEQDIELQVLEEEGENNTRKNKTQKKRTIMGQEKTATEFLVISFLMIGYFLIYPVLIVAIEQRGNATTSYTLQSIKGIISMERQVAKAISFMNTHLTNTSFPLSNQQNAMTVISDQYSLVLNLLGTVSTNFFFIGDILDEQYLSEYNSLFYNNLCQANSTCNSQAGQDKGFNVVLLNYIDYLVSKYLLIKNNTSYNLSTIYSYQVQTNQESYKVMLKKYWRKLQVLLINGYERFLQFHDSMLFGLMLTFSVLNLSVFLCIWLKFYNQLQKKIKATQYILTFIPLDQINKNQKIVQYIKQKIVKIN